MTVLHAVSWMCGLRSRDTRWWLMPSCVCQCSRKQYCKQQLRHVVPLLSLTVTQVQSTSAGSEQLGPEKAKRAFPISVYLVSFHQVSPSLLHRPLSKSWNMTLRVTDPFRNNNAKLLNNKWKTCLKDLLQILCWFVLPDWQTVHNIIMLHWNLQFSLFKVLSATNVKLRRWKIFDYWWDVGAFEHVL